MVSSQSKNAGNLRLPTRIPLAKTLLEKQDARRWSTRKPKGKRMDKEKKQIPSSLRVGARNAKETGPKRRDDWRENSRDGVRKESQTGGASMTGATVIATTCR